MSDSKRYQVVSACALIPVVEFDGSTVIKTLYRGMVFDAAPGNVRVKHNAESGYVVEIGADAVAGTDAAGEPLVDDQRTTGDGEPGDPVTLFDPGTVNEAAHRAAAEPAVQSTPDDPEAQAAAEVEAKREAARAKLPTDGTAPHHNAGEDVWREYAVSRGMDRAEVEKASKDDLKAALKS